MTLAIRIKTDGLSLDAELNDTRTAKAVHEALPLTAAANRWGEEIYFAIPVDEPAAPDATETVQVGDLGYWPEGKAFCVFFGRTPASTGEEPVAAGPVNVIGRVRGDVSVLKKVPQGAEVVLERA